MGKFGNQDYLFFVDGFNLLINKVKSIDFGETSVGEDDTGLGDGWEESSPAGQRSAHLTQQGAFFDDGALAIHTAMSSDIADDPDDAERIICVGSNGDEIGKLFTGYKGGYTLKYNIRSQKAEKVKAHAEYTINGPAEEGVVLQPLAQQTADWDTESTPVDGGAQTTTGGSGYLHVNAVTGFTNFVATVRDSPDDVTYGDLVAFPDNVTAPYGARVTVAGNVERYLAMDGNVTGTGTIDAWCGFARNP